MKLKTPKTHQAFINSSHLLLFILASIVWAWILSTNFPNSVRFEAFAFSIIFSIVIISLSYLLDQLYDDVTVPKIILTYFFASALMSVASAIRGPLVNGEIPVIRLLFFGPYLYSDSAPSLIYASVFTFYGGVTLVCATITSSLIDLIYSKTILYMPKNLQKFLRKVDHKVDIKAAQISDNIFFVDSKKGIIAILSLLGIYILLYFLILIF